jgi:hypothetical protein
MSAAGALAKDFRSVFSVDYFGNDIESLPMMQDINEATDFTMVNSFAIAVDTSYVYTWNRQYGVPVNQVLVAVCIPMGYSFWRAGLIVGMIPGARGCAELEVLLGEPGLGLLTSDALTTSHLFFIFCLGLGNYVHYKDKNRNG